MLLPPGERRPDTLGFPETHSVGPGNLMGPKHTFHRCCPDTCVLIAMGQAFCISKTCLSINENVCSEQSLGGITYFLTKLVIFPDSAITSTVLFPLPPRYQGQSVRGQQDSCPQMEGSKDAKPASGVLLRPTKPFCTYPFVAFYLQTSQIPTHIPIRMDPPKSKF